MSGVYVAAIDPRIVLWSRRRSLRFVSGVHRPRWYVALTAYMALTPKV